MAMSSISFTVTDCISQVYEYTKYILLGNNYIIDKPISLAHFNNLHIQSQCDRVEMIQTRIKEVLL